jgi:hypothetical protein
MGEDRLYHAPPARGRAPVLRPTGTGLHGTQDDWGRLT